MAIGISSASVVEIRFIAHADKKTANVFVQIDARSGYGPAFVGEAGSAGILQAQGKAATGKALVLTHAGFSQLNDLNGVGNNTFLINRRENPEYAEAFELRTIDPASEKLTGIGCAIFKQADSDCAPIGLDDEIGHWLIRPNHFATSLILGRKDQIAEIREQTLSAVGTGFAGSGKNDWRSHPQEPCRLVALVAH
jgi:hypothetical protein